MMLHITNGGSVVESMRVAGMGETHLAWNDVLHEGPVPAGLSLEEMGRIRAAFLASCGWGAPDHVAGEFVRRDQALARFRDYEEVVLWFEHDLYDQLQLIQLLHWFAGREWGAARLALICNQEYLGHLRPEELQARFPARRAVSASQLNLGRAAWEAFCAPDPADLGRLAVTESSDLPCLPGALLRFLEQFPGLGDGLSRTERQVLEVLSEGPSRFGEVFSAEQRKEERIFLGDATLWLYIHRLARAPVPLLTVEGKRLAITEVGREVLARRADSVRLNGIDRWLGGVHLEGPEALWRWDRENRRLV